MDDRKAWENLDAARILLKHDASNAAASRAYYAAYQACWVAMEEAGHPPGEVRPGVIYFVHEQFPDAALAARVLDEKGCRDLTYLRGLRVMADYHEDDLTVEQVRDAVETAGNLLFQTIGERPEW